MHGCIMGSVADKIARKLAPSRRSKVVDLASWNEGKKAVRQAGFDCENLIPTRFVNLDPCFGIYTMTANFVSLISGATS